MNIRRDRNNSNPPISDVSPRRRHKDYSRDRRDYKRRFSPPPYRRSPPPQFKRSRREDDSRRTGSPTRSGYEYLGYDHDMGGRPNYLDDRPYGGRSSGGLSDQDSGHADYSDMSNTGNNQREGLMSYKQFIQDLEDDVLPSEAELRYQEYKTEYITTQKRTYFEAHKDEEWLKNKYHPTNLTSVIERRNEVARKAAKEFLLDLQSAKLDLGPSANTNRSDQTSQPNSGDEVDGGAKRRQHGRLSTKEAELAAAPMSHSISSEPRRIQLDVELALALARKLDSEKGINDNILVKLDNDKIKDKTHGGSMVRVVIRGVTSVKGLEGVELLDTLLTYLWRVHGVDYYGRIEITEPKGLRHVRADRKTTNASNNGTEWEKKLDAYWQDRLKGQDPLVTMTANEKLDAAALEAFNPYVRKIRDEKYGWKFGCGAKGCAKLFHAAEFVQKHLKLKHPELGMELTSKVCEDLYFENYMNDPDAPGGKPVMQQTVQNEQKSSRMNPRILNDKVQRRRTPIKDRLKDDRGNRRDRVARGSGNERFDQSDDLLGEFQSNNDDLEKVNAEDDIEPDVPPLPVLMPVQGAGPLGPFVPAPPEVAKRIPFEVGGRSVHSRLGPRNIHSRLGPLPVTLPPNFQQDPRSLRSYQDLDAPEDEVTVIDYRSL